MDRNGGIYPLYVDHKLSPTLDTSQPPLSAVRRSRFGSGLLSIDTALYEPDLSRYRIG